MMNRLICVLASLNVAACCGKTEDAAIEPPTTEAANPAAHAELEPLTREQCESICRKQNVECNAGDAPPRGDLERVVMRCSEGCVASATRPTMARVAHVFHAQHECIGKADCDEYRKCRDAKERELKAKPHAPVVPDEH